MQVRLNQGTVLAAPLPAFDKGYGALAVDGDLFLGLITPSIFSTIRGGNWTDDEQR